MSLSIGLIGTGAIARMHARAHKSLGNPIRACTSLDVEQGRAFAAEFGAEFLPDYEDVCRHPDVEAIDVCTFPDFRLQPLELGGQARQTRAGRETGGDERRHCATDG